MGKSAMVLPVRRDRDHLYDNRRRFRQASPSETTIERTLWLSWLAWKFRCTELDMHEPPVSLYDWRRMGRPRAPGDG